MVIVDRLSVYIEAIPCLKRELTAQDVAQLFLDKCVCFMGVPLEILSDNDNLMTSEFLSELCSNLGIFQHKAILYRPKGNGRAERAVRSVVDILRLCLEENYGEKCWIKYLPWCTFLINSLPGVITHYSPHKIVFGRDLLLPGELPPVKKFREETTVDFHSALGELREKVQKRLLHIHDRERRKYLEKHSTVIYKPGIKSG